MQTSAASSLSTPSTLAALADPFPLDRWWVAGFGWELKDKPIARVILNRPMVLYRMPTGEVGALEDRCCHKELPLSCGTIESGGLRCGYHGLLFDRAGACIEIPGQERIPSKARVPSYALREQNQILWVWVGSTPDSQPDCDPPVYTVHDDPKYKFGGGVYHYDAAYQLIHDNLMDLSHLGYVHLNTIGGNASVHMNAKLKVEADGNTVRVTRWMPDSVPPPTYTAAWPFAGKVDRWQEVEFHVSHLLIWTGAMDVGADRLDNPARDGFHMRGFHGVTPATESTTHYFWTVATNPHPDMQNVTQTVVEQSAATFDEDKIVIEAQFRNQCRFPVRTSVDIHVDVGPNRARRVMERLTKRPSSSV
jgi:phenylpropionate dioxygenase-like ring-hydroxylating dioxygenase large terminal subunit